MVLEEEKVNLEKVAVGILEREKKQIDRFSRAKLPSNFKYTRVLT